MSPCVNPRPLLAPTPIAPTRLSRLAGRTRALKTVAAVAATVRDVRVQFVGDELAAGQATPPGALVAGLRSGRAIATGSGYRLRNVEFVPGVVVSGLVPVKAGRATLRVTGRGAPHGQLIFRADGSATGRLDGRKVVSRPARAAQVVARGLGLRKLRVDRRLQLG